VSGWLDSAALNTAVRRDERGLPDRIAHASGGNCGNAAGGVVESFVRHFECRTPRRTVSEGAERHYRGDHNEGDDGRNSPPHGEPIDHRAVILRFLSRSRIFSGGIVVQESTRGFSAGFLTVPSMAISLCGAYSP
jgi:hypothetical protein